MTQITNKSSEYFEMVETELNALSQQYLDIKTDLSYLEIKDDDTEDVIDQKEKDAKKKKNEITKIRTSIQKTAKAYRDGFNKASKDVIALEKPLTAPIMEDEEFLKTQINYKKMRAEKIANELHESRLEQISKFEGHYNPIFFGSMTNDQWSKTLEGAQESFDREKKIQEERLEQQRLEKEEAERLKAENEALRAQQKESQEKIEALESRSPEKESRGSRDAGQLAGSKKELRQLLNSIASVIAESDCPTDAKDQVIFQNTMQLLKKAHKYLEFNL